MRSHGSAEGGRWGWSNCDSQTATLESARGRTRAHGDDRTRGLRPDAVPGQAKNGRLRRRHGSDFGETTGPAGPDSAPDANEFREGRCRGLPGRLAAARSRRRSGREGLLRDPHPGPAVGLEPDRSCIELGRSFDAAADRLIACGSRSARWDSGGADPVDGTAGRYRGPDRAPLSRPQAPSGGQSRSRSPSTLTATRSPASCTESRARCA